MLLAKPQGFPQTVLTRKGPCASVSFYMEAVKNEPDHARSQCFGQSMLKRGGAKGDCSLCGIAKEGRPKKRTVFLLPRTLFRNGRI